MWGEHLLAGRGAVGRPRRLVRRRAAQPRVPGHRARSTGSAPSSRRCRPARARRPSPRRSTRPGQPGSRSLDHAGARAASPGSTATSPASPSRRRSTEGSSATSLQRWAECPYAYAMQNLLRDRTGREPRGAAPDHAARPRQPGPRGPRAVRRRGPRRSRRSRRHAAGATRSALARRDRRGGVRPLRGRGADRPAALLAARARPRSSPSFDRFLDEDDALPRGPPDAARRHRAAVRLDGAPRPCTFPLPDGRSVPMRGNADRVDLGADGTIHVLDYKTGSIRTTKESRPRTRTSDGTRLQLAVYGLAARQHAGPTRRPRCRPTTGSSRRGSSSSSIGLRGHRPRSSTPVSRASA